jgi:hypothetical protein
LNFGLIILIYQKWEYMNVPEEGSEEYKLMEILKNPKEWI